MAAATKRDITHVFEEWFQLGGPRRPEARDESENQKAQDDPAAVEAAVQAFTLWSDGFNVTFRVAIEYGTFLPHITATASFKDTMHWKIEAVRVFWGEEVRIEIDHLTLRVKFDEAARFCEYLTFDL